MLFVLCKINDKNNIILLNTLGLNYFSLKDYQKAQKFFLEALKSDGVEISKKYKNLYEINKSEMPSDIQTMIDNKEVGAALLRVIEVIGPDKIEDIDDDTFYFIISTLNQLNTDLIRNKLLLKVLPLKV